MYRGKFRQGKFKPKNPEKYAGNVNDIVYRSSWEWKFFCWCDTNPNVLSWCSEEIVVPYYSEADGKARRYFIDAAMKVRTADGGSKSVLVEIKPEAQTKPPIVSNRKKPETMLQEAYTWQVNQDKWKAAKEFARRRGAEFVVLTEKDLGIR